MDTPISTPNPDTTSTLSPSEERADAVCKAPIPEEQALVCVTGDDLWSDTQPLAIAARNGDLAEVQRLLEQEAEDQIPYGYGRSLVLSARYGHGEIMKSLVEFIRQKHKGISAPDALRKARKTRAANQALEEAIANKRFDIVCYFLKQRIHKYSDVVTQTVKSGCFEMVKGLVYNISRLTRVRKGVLDEAAYQATLQGRLDIAKYLVEKGANIHANHQTLARQETLLVAASRLGFLEIVTWLVQQGADIHANNNDALWWAVKENHLPVVRYLAEQGGDLHVNKECLLITASSNGYEEIVQYLVEQGADIHALNDGALASASQNGHQAVIEYLVQQGADIYAQNEAALRVACAGLHLEAVKVRRGGALRNTQQS